MTFIINNMLLHLKQEREADRHRQEHLTDRDGQHDKRIRDNVRRRDVRQRESLRYKKRQANTERNIVDNIVWASRQTGRRKRQMCSIREERD